MQAFLSIAVILGLSALFSYINERFLRLQQTIGLMLLALGFTLVLMTLSALGVSEVLTEEQTFVKGLSLDETLLNGVLCFMLFAGSINVKIWWSETSACRAWRSSNAHRSRPSGKRWTKSSTPCCSC